MKVAAAVVHFGLQTACVCGSGPPEGAQHVRRGAVGVGMGRRPLLIGALAAL